MRPLTLGSIWPTGTGRSCGPDEAIWDWIREDITANTCFGTAAKVRDKIDTFSAGLAESMDEVRQRCRRDLQAQADAPVEAASQ